MSRGNGKVCLLDGIDFNGDCLFCRSDCSINEDLRKCGRVESFFPVEIERLESEEFVRFWELNRLTCLDTKFENSW